MRTLSFEVRALSCRTWAGEVERAVAERRATSQLFEVAFIVSIEGLLIYPNLGRDAGSIGPLSHKLDQSTEVAAVLGCSQQPFPTSLPTLLQASQLVGQRLSGTAGPVGLTQLSEATLAPGRRDV